MRSIKFRAWHFAEKKMLEVDELNHIASWSFEGMLGVNGINRTIGIQGGKHNDCVVMQSTGLLDKNGKEIYEGDIIRMSLDGLRTFVCIYEKGGFQFQDLVHKTVCSNAGSYITHYIEIIGNVHENPELLNQ